MKARRPLVGALAVLALAAGCAGPAVRPFLPPPHAGEGARRFASADERKVLTASVATLQDLGFSLANGDSALGLIVATKERSAQGAKSNAETTTEVVAVAAVVAGSVVLAGPLGPLFLLAHGGGGDSDPPHRQELRVSISVGAAAAPETGTIVRLSAQRIVYSRGNRVLLAETLSDPALTQAFYGALSKSLFLQAHHL